MKLSYIFMLFLQQVMANEEKVSSGTVIWKDAIVPYNIATEDKDIISSVSAALNELQAQTCVKFVPCEQGKQCLTINIAEEMICNSTIGYQEKMQNAIFLNKKACSKKGDVLHELMHVLGFQHENIRPDRDNYILVLWDNIRPESRLHFKTLHNSYFPVHTMYDYDSITHLKPISYARMEKLSFIPLMKASGIGQRVKLSQLDIFKVNKLYGCDKTKACYDNLQTKNCINEGIAENKCGNNTWAETHCAQTCGICESGNYVANDISPWCQRLTPHVCGEVLMKRYCPSKCRVGKENVKQVNKKRKSDEAMQPRNSNEEITGNNTSENTEDFGKHKNAKQNLSIRNGVKGALEVAKREGGGKNIPETEKDERKSEDAKQSINIETNNENKNSTSADNIARNDGEKRSFGITKRDKVSKNLTVMEDIKEKDENEKLSEDMQE